MTKVTNLSPQMVKAGTYIKNPGSMFLELADISEKKINERLQECRKNLVKQNGRILKYIEEQTPEICLAAVKQDGRALEYVKDQTPEICLEAVKQNEYAKLFVKDSALDNI